jgi:hypothetical protein
VGEVHGRHGVKGNHGDSTGIFCLLMGKKVRGEVDN